jgi:hypothetical protein
MAPARAAVSPDQEGAFSMGSSHTLDQLDICAIANAGLLLPATLTERLGIEQAADALTDLGERAGAHRPGRKLLTPVHSIRPAGWCCICPAGRGRRGSSRHWPGCAASPTPPDTTTGPGKLPRPDRASASLPKHAWPAARVLPIDPNRPRRRLDHASSTHPQPLPTGPHDRTSSPRIPASVDPGLDLERHEGIRNALRLA